jgi:hypothetical protein
VPKYRISHAFEPFPSTDQGTFAEVDIEQLLRKIIDNLVQQTQNLVSLSEDFDRMLHPPAIHKPLEVQTSTMELKVGGWGKPSRTRDADIDDVSDY